MKKIHFYFLLVSLFFVLGVSCSLQKNNVQNIDLSSLVDTEIKNEIKKEIIVRNENIKNCQTDLSCFKETAKTCQLARVKNSYTVNNMGIDLNFSDYYEIKGLVGEKCLFYMKTNTLTTKYSDEIRELLFGQGISYEQIKEYEDAGNKEAEMNYNGKDGYCFFIYNDDLKNLIDHWSNNDYSSLSIMDMAQCSGDLFNNSI